MFCIYFSNFCEKVAVGISLENPSSRATVGISGDRWKIQILTNVSLSTRWNIWRALEFRWNSLEIGALEFRWNSLEFIFRRILFANVVVSSNYLVFKCISRIS